MSEGALHEKGLMLWRAGRFDEALDVLGRVVDEVPNEPAYRNSFGIVLVSLLMPRAAAISFRSALALEPSDPFVWSNLGNAVRALKQTDEAAVSYRRSLTLSPEASGTLGNLANLLHAMDAWEAAKVLYRKALALHPGFCEAWSNYGAGRQALGDLAGAAASFERAIASDPKFAEGWWNRALLRLLAGDYDRGLSDYEWRWRRDGHSRPSFSVASWTDEDLRDRRILVWAEQGAGDCIQFMRFVPALAARGAAVVVAVPRRLVSLVASLPGVAEVSVLGEGPMPSTDFEVPMLSLPYRLGLGAAAMTIPAADINCPTWSTPIRDERPIVGLVWAGDPVNRSDARRSIGLGMFRSLLLLPGIRWVSLQFGPRATDIVAEGLEGSIEDWSQILGDFAQTGSVVSTAVDLVVTVDTATAHLAGSLRKETWVLLSHVPDWRWGLSGARTPWYPSLRLFRQPTPGDWNSVVGRLADEITRWRKGRSSMAS